MFNVTLEYDDSKDYLVASGFVGESMLHCDCLSAPFLCSLYMKCLQKLSDFFPTLFSASFSSTQIYRLPVCIVIKDINPYRIRFIYSA